MARLHSRKKGKSGTKRPKSMVSPEWVEADVNEIKRLIVKMAKEGVPPSKIALMLRDQHAIPNIRAFLGMSMTAFLKSEGALPEYPEDLISLIKKAIRMREHIKKDGKRDTHNKVKLRHVESKIIRLVNYYRKNGAIPSDWTYDAEKVALLVK
ncbi:MAG: 30S ribosomal protein S15 [Candidatus Micrarchaeota archaeon]